MREDNGKDAVEAVFDIASSSRMDSWINSQTGQGTSRDKSRYTFFSKPSNITRDRVLLSGLYSGNDLVRKIIDVYSEDMTREWLEVKIQDEDGNSKKEAVDINMMLDRMNIQSLTADALTWAKLYGGALMILSINDGNPPDEPLNMDSIKSVDWVKVVDRWSVSVAHTYNVDDDVTDNMIGKPRLYMITDGSVEKFIHESRVIRFDGVRSTYEKWKTNGRWNDSLIESIYDNLRDFDSGLKSVIVSMQDFSQAVYKIKNLAQLLKSDRDGVVLKRLSQLDQCRSNYRAIPIDAEHEDFSQVANGVLGLPDLIDRAMMRVSAGVDIPLTRLFGRSPAGMSSTGKSDEDNFLKKIRGMQMAELLPRMRRLVEIMMRSKDSATKGVLPKSWSIEFNPLYVETPAEIAETRYKNAMTDKIYLEMGVLSPEEIRQSRFGGDEYSMDTTLDPSTKTERSFSKPDPETVAS